MPRSASSVQAQQFVNLTFQLEKLYENIKTKADVHEELRTEYSTDSLRISLRNIAGWFEEVCDRKVRRAKDGALVG